MKNEEMPCNGTSATSCFSSASKLNEIGPTLGEGVPPPPPPAEIIIAVGSVVVEVVVEVVVVVESEEGEWEWEWEWEGESEVIVIEYARGDRVVVRRIIYLVASDLKGISSKIKVEVTPRGIDLSGVVSGALLEIIYRLAVRVLRCSREELTVPTMSKN